MEVVDKLKGKRKGYENLPECPEKDKFIERESQVPTENFVRKDLQGVNKTITKVFVVRGKLDDVIGWQS